MWQLNTELHTKKYGGSSWGSRHAPITAATNGGITPTVGKISRGGHLGRRSKYGMGIPEDLRTEMSGVREDADS